MKEQKEAQEGGNGYARKGEMKRKKFTEGKREPRGGGRGEEERRRRAGGRKEKG